MAIAQIQRGYLSGVDAMDTLQSVLSTPPTVADPFPGVSWHKLTNKQRKAACDYAKQHSFNLDLECDKALWWKLFGIVSVPIGTPHIHFTHGKAGPERQNFKLLANVKNRDISTTAWLRYQLQIAINEWRPDGQPIAFYWSPENGGYAIATGQHRGIAGAKAFLEDTTGTLTISVTIRFNVPYCFSDGYDLAKAFTTKDAIAKHRDDIFEAEPIYTKDDDGKTVATGEYALCVDVGGASCPDREPMLFAGYQATMRSLIARMKGSQGIKTSGKADTDRMVDTENESNGNLAKIVAKTVQVVLKRNLGANDTNRLKPLTVPMVATAMILLANRDNRDTKLLVDPADDDKAMELLSELTSDNWGVFADSLAVIRDRKKQPNVPAPRKFDVFVYAVKSWLETGTPKRITLGEAANRWDSKVVSFDEAGIQTSGPNPKYTSYPHFGGLDVGQQEQKRGKKAKEEDTDSDE